MFTLVPRYIEFESIVHPPIAPDVPVIFPDISTELAYSFPSVPTLKNLADIAPDDQIVILPSDVVLLALFVAFVPE